eukprot:CAMPEP_0202445884 /NCGR_PEP_ID=MMETSP1360-20130828/4606_1 /ASSEMBLY_ACC=CAM_ASM_000848 /TAXON_ID=515479 /ORGANISM="Licmophora paradoxa, Strain CCMP2313" /LENGTH=98 /DNA_ID=CAMNT_0049062287 /DNA_START=12 /DNA_END=308 /DNA_ORIENTATION=-
MVASRAFSRSRVIMARYDVSPHMVKWWSKVRPDDGQVSRHLSPFEQHAIMPWFKTWPKKMIDRAPDYIVWLGGSLSIVFATAAWADAADAAEDFSHRY